MFRVLLADDSRTTRKIVELSLAGEKFDVETVVDGIQAWDLLQQEPFHVLVADAGLPRIEGYDLSRRVKQDPALNRVSVILLGGAFSPLDPDRVTWSGADATLVKPFETTEFIRLVERLAEQSEGLRYTSGGSQADEGSGVIQGTEEGTDSDLFSLTFEECRGTFRLPERRIWQAKSDAGKGRLTDDQIARLAEELARRLPETLRDLAPELAHRWPEGR